LDKKVPFNILKQSESGSEIRIRTGFALAGMGCPSALVFIIIFYYFELWELKLMNFTTMTMPNNNCVWLLKTCCG